MVKKKKSFSRAEEGYDRGLSESAQNKFTSTLLQFLRDRNVSLQLGENENNKICVCVVFNHLSGYCFCISAVNVTFCLCWCQDTVVTVPGDHHAHLNTPEVVAPFVSNFLRTKVLSPSTSRDNKL